MDQSTSPFVNVVLRAEIEPEPLTRAVTAAVHEVDKDQVVAEVRTLERIKTQSAAVNRLRTTLLAVFAGLAVVLSAVGIYGVISYSVAQRTHELGVRAALGAPRAALLGMVLRNGMTLAGLGLGLGVAGALALTRVLATLLIGVGARDPITLAGAAALLAAVAFLACYVPARRAARLDPVAALRDN